MGTYRGPHVEVTENFETNAPAVALESLPSTAIATAYDVYKKEAIGQVLGILPTKKVVWGIDDVLFDESVSGKRAYNFYPVKIYADTFFGDILLEDVEKDDDGVSIDVDESFTVPNTDKTDSGYLPYYKKIGTAGDVKILGTDLSTVIIVGGNVVTERIRVGEKVFVTIDGGTSWTLVGVVGALTGSENKIKLATPYSAAITTGDGITVGAASVDLEDYVDILYDINADFIGKKVKPGDIVVFSSNSIPDSEGTPIEATVISIINKNTLRFNTDALISGKIDYDFLKYKASTVSISSTADLSSYKIKRLIGFSENYGLKILDVQVVDLSNVKLSYPISGNPAMTIGDQFALTTSRPGDRTDERTMDNLRLYTVKTFVINGSDYEVTTDSIIYKSVESGEVEFVTGDYLTAWNPKIISTIKSDFRSIRSQEAGVVKRIASIDDIVSFFCKDTIIDIHNELAYMMQAIYARSGGKVCYGVNVTSKIAEQLTEYTDAIEELKIIDVYSHCFGTTDPGINALMGDYVDGQSDPYEAHERIAHLSYDEEDIYKMGSDTASEIAEDGTMTIDGAFNPSTAGLTVGDKVEITDEDGIFIGTFNVVETPTELDTIKTDFSDYGLNNASVTFICGRKDAQAVKIGAIKYGNRRIKVMWPGYFIADFGGETFTLPPYYIAAARCGMDGAITVSQSCTNYTFSLPGLSNIQLNTNYYFRKEQLDEIGGGGVDIMIQDSSMSQTIKSRHDLTSNMDAIEYREWSITKQADSAAKLYRASVNPYVGKYNITDDLIQFLRSVLKIATDVLIKKTIIKKAEIISVAQDELVVDKINAVIAITVYIAGNYFDIILNIKSK